MTGTDLFGLQTSRTQATREPEALLNAAKFAAVRSGTRDLDVQIQRYVEPFDIKGLFIDECFVQLSIAGKAGQ
jgi:hypothetical protein